MCMPKADSRRELVTIIDKLHDTLVKLKRNMERSEENIREITDILASFEEIMYKVRDTFEPSQMWIFDKENFPNKESIISFVWQYYRRKLPIKWTRHKIEREATRIIQKSRDLDRTNKFISEYLEARRNVQVINVLSMTSEDIRKEFMNEKKYPDIEFIKLALQPSFRMKLKGITTRESAIKKIIDEVGKLKSVGRILME